MVAYSPSYFRGVTLYLDLPEFLRMLFSKSLFLTDKFRLYNLVGCLKVYPCKLLLLFGAVHLTSKLPYFDNCKYIYFLIVLFLENLYYGC